MWHKPWSMGRELIIRAHEGPGIRSRYIIDADGKDGIWEGSRRGDDSSMEGVQDCTGSLAEIY
jgi:hypothetical protein